MHALRTEPSSDHLMHATETAAVQQPDTPVGGFTSCWLGAWCLCLGEKQLRAAAPSLSYYQHLVRLTGRLRRSSTMTELN